MHPKDIAITDYAYQLPDARVARYPVSPRDTSKLLVYHNGDIATDTYSQLPAYLPACSLAVFNETKVIHARLLFPRASGSSIEVFCLEPHPGYADVQTAMQQHDRVLWQCLVGGAKKWKPGVTLVHAYPEYGFTLEASVESRNDNSFTIELAWDNPALSFAEVLHKAGELPLPPYLGRKADEQDQQTYQTIYAKEEGSVAAPTAGLHFTPAVMERLAHKNVATGFVTLHVGAGTFMPVKTSTMETHPMHAEWIEVTLPFLVQLREKLQQPVVAVGTTSLRTLESLYHIGNQLANGQVVDWNSYAVTQWQPYSTTTFVPADAAIDAIVHYLQAQQLDKLVTRTQILIAPGYVFRIVTGLLTNFHQPQSTLLLLVAALVGPDWKRIYQFALDNDFRFLSYGDGSLLWGQTPGKD